MSDETRTVTVEQLQQAVRVLAPIAHLWEPDESHRRTGGPVLGDFALCPHPRCVSANDLLVAALPTSTEDPLDISNHEERQAEVAEMIAEGDANSDDGLMGPDGLADALLTLAEGWVRQSLASRLPTSTEGLTAERATQEIAAILACPHCGGDSEYDRGRIAVLLWVASLSPSPTEENPK